MSNKLQKEFWENKFKTEGTSWTFEPSDSALLTKKLFNLNNIKKILIPGIGFGRNARIFYDSGFNITGIEISETAIQLARENGLNYAVHHGSVLNMPFDKERYEGIFCYALLHLFTRNERKKILQLCYNQLQTNGIMIFVIISVKSGMYGQGKQLSKNRFEIDKGLNVFFYDLESVNNEFKSLGITDVFEIDEPVKHLEGFEPIKCIYVVCRKISNGSNENK